MIEYRLVKKDYKVLKELGKENWILSCIDGEVMIFYREVKRKAPETKIDKESPEWKEFIKAYRDINNNGSYDKRLISKYHKVIKETPHKQIMENLKDYKKFLQVNKTRNPLQAPTYINQERYMDTWEVIKDVSRKFINDIYKEKDLNADEIDNINTEISAYELKHKREVTNGVVRNMIELLLNK